MVVTCPSCASRYRIRKELDERGVSVACPACSHAFVVHPGSPLAEAVGLGAYESTLDGPAVSTGAGPAVRPEPAEPPPVPETIQTSVAPRDRSRPTDPSALARRLLDEAGVAGSSASPAPEAPPQAGRTVASAVMVVVLLLMCVVGGALVGVGDVLRGMP